GVGAGQAAGRARAGAAGEAVGGRGADDRVAAATTDDVLDIGPHVVALVGFAVVGHAVEGDLHRGAPPGVADRVGAGPANENIGAVTDAHEQHVVAFITVNGVVA